MRAWQGRGEEGPEPACHVNRVLLGAINLRIISVMDFSAVASS